MGHVGSQTHHCTSGDSRGQAISPEGPLVVNDGVKGLVVNDGVKGLVVNDGVKGLVVNDGVKEGIKKMSTNVLPALKY
jgi:hypothetical protein